MPRLVFGAFATLCIAALAATIEVEDARRLYRSLKREFQETAFVLTTTAVPCPREAFVIVVLGQSNAGNHIEGRIPADPSVEAYSFFHGRCYVIEDPVPGSSGSAGSLWSLFAQRVSAGVRRPVVVIGGAEAGSSVVDWLDPKTRIAERAVHAIERVRRVGLQPSLVIWLQGETDASRNMDHERYVQHLKQLMVRLSAAAAEPRAASMRAERPAWMVLQATRCGPPSSKNELVRAAQRAVADEAQGI